MSKVSNKTKGIICILISSFCFSGMSSFINLSGDVPVPQKVFFRNLVAFFCASFVLIKNHEPFKPTKGCMPFHMLRASLGLLGVFGNFYATTHMAHTADAAMLNKLSPFFAIIFSIFLLKEKPTLVQVIGVVTAFVGSMCIIKPTMGGYSVFPAVMGAIGGLGAGIAYTFVRYLGQKGENSSVIIFFFSAFSSLVCLPFMLFNFSALSLRSMICLICAGISACVGQFGITRAYVYAPAKEISVYDYTQVIFAAVFGFFLFDQIPDMLSVLGYCLICGAGIAMFFYNRNRT